MKFPKFKGPKDEIKVYGLFGFPLAHSLSADIHNAAFRELGMPAIYLPFERSRSQFLKLIHSKKRMILDGFNLTIPHKETILPYLDKIDPTAKLVGAVNTVKRIGNQWIGYNTDVFGFLAGLKEAKFRANGKKAVVLGAGGAARAVVAALSKYGIHEIVVVNRTSSRARLLVNEFRTKLRKVILRNASASSLKQELENADILVNATSVGLKLKDFTVLLKSDFPKRKILVYDLIYHVEKTPLLALASRLGHKIRNGETMLLMQGAKAFEIWTGKKAPINVMRKALRDAV